MTWTSATVSTRATHTRPSTAIRPSGCSHATATRFLEDGYARSPLDDAGAFQDSLTLTVECVIDMTATSFRGFVLGPWDTGVGDHTFILNLAGAIVYQSTSGATTAGPFPGTPGTHHLAATFDGDASRPATTARSLTRSKESLLDTGLVVNDP